MFGYHKKTEQILESLDAEQAADTRMLDTEARIIAERPPAAAAGVDLAAIKQVDPGFDDQGFLGIAREIFYDAARVHAAAGPALPEPEIRAAVITAASVSDGREVVTVRFTLVDGAEDWTFQRDPAADTTATDEAHLLIPEADGGWLLAHRGWAATTTNRA